MPTKEVAIGGEEGIVLARQAARELARELGFSMIDQTRIATAVSELARNVVRYADRGEGSVTIRALTADATPGLEVVVCDEGPGIEDIDAVMRPGYTSGNGMGLGLPGASRLMDHMDIQSRPGVGTTITIRKWLR